MGERSRILCATDFSDAADGALAWAARLAKPTGAEVHLVHALQAPLHTAAATGYLHDTALDEEQRQRANAELASRAERFGVVSAVVCRGAMDTEILRHATELRADLLVTGVSSGEGRTHALLGSVGERLIRSAHLPIVSVPASKTERGMGSILVPTDLSPAADTALGRLSAIIERFAEETDVHLLHVLDLPPYLRRQASFLEELERAIRIELHELAARHRSGRVRVHEELHHGKAAEVIAQRASELNVDLIAMPSHGRTGLARFFLGSVAERVARAGVRPTLTFHPANDDAGQDGAQ